MSEGDHTGPPAPTPIEAPADFPVIWEDPDDAKLPWQFDPLHFPHPLPILEGGMWCDFTVNGFNHAFEAYEIPTRGDARIIKHLLLYGHVSGRSA